MTNPCKNCKKNFSSGLWLSPQFVEEGVLLFCSGKCKKEYLQMKLVRIKAEYPEYYNKIVKSANSAKLDKEVYAPFVELVKKEVEE